MPFYFRIPLPGPFGYSARVGGRKRRSRSKSYHGTLPGWRCEHNHRTETAARECAARHAASQQRVTGRAPAAPAAPAGRTYTASFGDWSCAHSHTTERDATLCALQRKLDEVTDLEKEIAAIDLTDATPEMRQHHAEQLARAASWRAETLAEMQAL